MSPKMSPNMSPSMSPSMSPRMTIKTDDNFIKIISNNINK